MDLPRGIAVVPSRDGEPNAASRQTPPADVVSFDDWVVSVAAELLRFARVTARGVDPADLVQDALVAVFARWSKLSRPDLAGAYARRVIVNSHVSRWRRWGRQVTSVDPMLLDASSSSGLEREEVVAARQLLVSLPVRQRAAVHLRFFDDLTYREIGNILGCREATARSHVHRALRQLQHQISEDAADE